MMRASLLSIVTLVVLAGCAMQSETVVHGAGPDDLLKLRAGPGLDQRVIVGIPDGTRLIRHDCLNTNGRAWCRVSLADRPAVRGYVSAAYLAGN